MDSKNVNYSSPTLAEYEPGASQPCHDGFRYLTVTERAARAEILHRAYSIWESKGSAGNSQLSDWLEAESEVLSEV